MHFSDINLSKSQQESNFLKSLLSMEFIINHTLKMTTWREVKQWCYYSIGMFVAWITAESLEINILLRCPHLPIHPHGRRLNIFVSINEVFLKVKISLIPLHFFPYVIQPMYRLSCLFPPHPPSCWLWYFLSIVRGAQLTVPKWSGGKGGGRWVEKG